MNHSDVQSRMADYLDGDLGLDERALVDAERGGVTRNQEQPDLSDNGLTASKTTEPDDILRRAFIAKW